MSALLKQGGDLTQCRNLRPWVDAVARFAISIDPDGADAGRLCAFYILEGGVSDMQHPGGAD